MKSLCHKKPNLNFQYMTKIAKATIISFLLVLYACISIWIIILPIGRISRRKLLFKNTSFFSRLGLAVLGVRVDLLGNRHCLADNQHYLIVANHLSSVDILVLSAIHPAVFITSKELGRAFPLGMLARFGGSIFVERISPAGLKSEITEVSNVLKTGSSVVLFPEGTTSDGETVHPFKSALFTAALSTNTPILPLCIRYLSINGQPINAQNKDNLFYYGRISFLTHVSRLLSLQSVHVECTVLSPVLVDCKHDRKALASQCYKAVLCIYKKDASD